MKINTKIAICIISSIMICSVTQFFINRTVVSTKIQEMTRKKLDEKAGSVLSFIEKDKLTFKDLEKTLNREIVIGKTGFVFIVDTKGNMVIHKKVQGKNWIKKPFIKYISEKRDGYHRYLSPKTKTYKVASFKYYKPKDWIIVASAFEDEDLKSPLRQMGTTSAFIMTPLAIILFLVFFLIIRARVIKPLNEVVDNMKNIAQGEGDLTKRIVVKSQDEIGVLGKAFNTFQEKLGAIIKEAYDYSSKVDDASVKMLEITKTVSKETDTISSKTSIIAGSTTDVNNRMDSVSSAIEESNSSISMIADSMEGMNGTINEISQTSSKVKEISEKAVEVSKETSARIVELGNSANEIGDVTETITEISEQTNLLALNATIEAARAGDAGKGFAVVANEIKTLASQTTDAAQNINRKILGIQNSTKNSVESIQEITKIINQCNSLITSMAISIDDQTTTTSEISGNILLLSNGVEEVSTNVNNSSVVIDSMREEVDFTNRSVLELTESGSEMTTNAEQVAELANQLKQLMDVFKI